MSIKNAIIIVFSLHSMLIFGMDGLSTDVKSNAKVAINPIQREDIKMQLDMDEKDYNIVFAKLKHLLRQNNLDAAAGLMHFPFYTSMANSVSGTGCAIDPISRQEFNKYKKDIFTNEVLSLIVQSSDAQVSKIANYTDDPYYSSLAKHCDRGSNLFELYFQYPEKETNAEGFVSFIFGRIQGKYKIVGTYSKWPIK